VTSISSAEGSCSDASDAQDFDPSDGLCRATKTSDDDRGHATSISVSCLDLYHVIVNAAHWGNRRHARATRVVDLGRN
jgi:hypothetical protein